jgi:DNA-binding NarL/FixJ family response regulator
VVALVAAGLSNREIDRRLVISEHTVHRQVTSILRKWDVPSRAAAASLAARHGLA